MRYLLLTICYLTTACIDRSSQEPSTTISSDNIPSSEKKEGGMEYTTGLWDEKSSTNIASDSIPSTMKPWSRRPYVPKPFGQTPIIIYPSFDGPWNKEQWSKEISSEEPSSEESSKENLQDTTPSKKPFNRRTYVPKPYGKTPISIYPSIDGSWNKEQRSKKPSGKKPSSEEPTSEEPTSEEPTSEEPWGEEPWGEESSSEISLTENSNCQLPLDENLSFDNNFVHAEASKCQINTVLEMTILLLIAFHIPG